MALQWCVYGAMLKKRRKFDKVVVNHLQDPIFFNVWGKLGFIVGAIWMHVETKFHRGRETRAIVQNKFKKM